MKFPIALASAAMAAALGFAPAAVAAKADPQQAAVFLGGTGTGMIPAGPVAPAQFITPWVSGPYKGLNMIYNGAPWAIQDGESPAQVELRKIADGLAHRSRNLAGRGLGVTPL